jgi:hypothetical protein
LKLAYRSRSFPDATRSNLATRRFNLERYVILYSVGADRIEILRVLPGEVDLERVLGNR